MTELIRPIWDACTESQRNVLVVLAAHGWENHRIARELGTTPAAVKSHIRSMCDKLKLKGRIALVVAYLAECQARSLPDSYQATRNPIRLNGGTPND